MIFDQGSALLAITETVEVYNTKAVYYRGILKEVKKDPFYIDAVVIPNPRQQLFNHEADRIRTQIKMISLSYLELNRRGNLYSTVSYKAEDFKVIQRGDWNSFGYFNYLLELIVYEETG